MQETKVINLRVGSSETTREAPL